MPNLEGSLRCRTIDPTTDGVLNGFCCGKRGDGAEREVHRIVGELRTGKRPMAEVRVMEEVPPGSLVGLAAVGEIVQFPNPRLGRFIGCPHITVIALSEGYRGSDSRGDGPHLGDLLLIDALSHTKAKGRGGMQWVFAYVAQANKPSRDLFQRHGFELLVPAENPHVDNLYRRPKNLALRTAAMIATDERTHAAMRSG